MEYRAATAFADGTTMRRSSHHCSCRGVMPVSETTSRDVKGCCMQSQKMFKTVRSQMFGTFLAQMGRCQLWISPKRG